LQKLRHKNVIKLYESNYLETDNHKLFFMELCQGGDLLTYVRKRKALTENSAKYFFK
jgi:serine/threonine protein kinase